MKYQALALKYRPSKWSEFRGQENLVTFLSNLVRRGQVGKNTIIHGIHGSGKTSSARYYAQCLLCDALEDGDACQVCEGCKLFQQGGHPSFLEADGATKGGKEDIKEIVEIAETPPLIGERRIIILDEVQGLSRQAWDALLKLVEEPPSYLVFLFLTTEIHKVREAIKSRCVLFEVKRLSDPDSLDLLQHLCSEESFTFNEQALKAIAHVSKGHPRDLIKNLEQVSFFGDIIMENVSRVFNLGFVKTLVKVFEALWDADPTKMLLLLDQWDDPAHLISQYLREFTMYLQYVQSYKLDVAVNPAFSSIPRKKLGALWGSFEKQAEEVGVETEKALTQIIQLLYVQEANSKVSLATILIRVHNFIHVQRMSSPQAVGEPAAKRTAIQHAKKASKGRGGRQFTASFVETNGLSKENIMEGGGTKEEELPDKVYPHTLLQYGFTRYDTKQFNIRIVG